MNSWLDDAIVYEIYPQSFYDSNGDGIGDLQGIIDKLEYVAQLGFTAIWLNPINPSSFRDAGYDVTDFYDVDPRYGTIEDYKALCDAVHTKGMKIIFDLVAGHTSIDHPWFIESAKVEKNPYTNRYIWTTSTFDDGPGIAALGERDAKCINNFFWSQPALNYGYAHPNPERPWELPVTHPDCIAMKEELKKIIDFWIDLGTDAFRVDMAPSLIKGDDDGAAMQKFWHEIRGHIQKKNPDVLLIAEWGQPADAIKAGFHLDFLLHFGPIAYTSLFRYESGRNTFSHTVGNSYFHKDGKGNINDYLDRYLDDCSKIQGRGYIGMVTGNHDMQRIAYRRDVDEVKVCMAFLFTMPGVPFVYYGDEIGMDYIEGLPSKEGGYIRTGSRTPMQWNNNKNHGFSVSDAPYLPTDNRPGAPTVADQEKDSASLLAFVKDLITLRKNADALLPEAELQILHAGYPFVYERISKNQKLFIALNPSKYSYCIKTPKLRQILFAQNVENQEEQIMMDGISLFIAIE